MPSSENRDPSLPSPQSQKQVLWGPRLRSGFQKSRYLFTTDHKMIGRQYFFLSLAAVLVGAWLSLLMRIHLVLPKAALPFLGEIKPENYLAYLTMHGTLMVFFVLSTVPQNGFGTFFLPLQLGASEMACPRLILRGLRTLHGLSLVP